MDSSFDRIANGKNEWLTPPAILKSLGRFDLDPCAPINRPWEIADIHYTIEDDGLNRDWHGRVFCNPPYGMETGKWLSKCAAHGNCIALTFARTETKMFFDYVWETAESVFFIKGRLRFFHSSGIQGGTAGAPSILIAYDHANSLVLKNCGLKGRFIWLKNYRYNSQEIK